MRAFLGPCGLVLFSSTGPRFPSIILGAIMPGKRPRWLWPLVILLWLGQGKSILGGTTGVLAGFVHLNDGAPLVGARVTATAPSEATSVVTDARGYFVFLSLAPDTYAVTASKRDYDTVSFSGARVLADNTRVIALVTRKTVVLGTVNVRPITSLLQPGVVADVYSINEEQTDKVQLLGGGGNIANIYSSLSAVPGVRVPPFQNGYNQFVAIRGVFQIGFEYDGVPVNRSFDNAPTTVGSTLGQRELQIYSGGAPANAEAFGLGGFINQVIKSGTYPGFAEADFAMQSPTFYNGGSLEAGGATSNRSFSYYLAIGGYNYSPRYYDNFDGASLTSTYGPPIDLVACPSPPTPKNDSLISCYANANFGFLNSPFGPSGPFGPGGYILGPFNLFGTSNITDRETVANLHFRVPHHHDEGSDDVQLLYSSSFLYNPIYSSYTDFGGKSFWTSDSAAGFLPNPPSFPVGYQYTGRIGQAIPNNCPSPCSIVPYSFPSSNALPGTPIAATLRDSANNGEGIMKLQYQHNIGSRAYLRLYGYSFYSWWFINQPNASSACVFFCFNTDSDYELSTHTRGLSAIYAVQANDKNLFNVEGSFVTATSLRDNNFQMFNAGSPLAVLVDARAPFSGLCFTLSGALGSCEPGTAASAAFLRLQQVFQSGVTGSNNVSGLTCNPNVAKIPAGPCEWLAVENGERGFYNAVRPEFSSASLTDQIAATSALQLNLGLRFDRFVFITADTTGPARQFWFNAWNQNECVGTAPGSVPIDKANLPLPLLPTSACPSGMLPATMDNRSAQVFSYSLLAPRIGATYRLSGEDDVLRINYGKYGQPPLAASEQYSVLQQNLPLALAPFFPYGFNTPGHALGPTVSYNLDFSWEHRFHGSDIEFKVTPYVQRTKNEYFTGIVLDQTTGFSASLPDAQRDTDGVEFELRKGDFAKNGFTWQLAYGYIHGLTSVAALPNGATFETQNNNFIRFYNAYTSFCATHRADPRCGLPSDGLAAAPCYDSSGAPVAACPSGAVANPYWNAPAQELITSSHVRYVGPPSVATVILNYKAGRFAVTPTLQFFGEARYGDPAVVPGIDPASNCSALTGSIAGDPRYPYGAPGGSPYNATTCTGFLPAIPDPYTHVFDEHGAFQAPNQLLANIQFAYAATPGVQYTLGASNVIDSCWGGTTKPWTLRQSILTCAYFQAASTGNIYNPDSQIQPIARFPYIGFPSRAPASLTFQAKLKW